MGFFSKLKSGLSKTRSKLGDGIANVVLGKKQIDDELLEDLETTLLQADVGVETTELLISRTKEQLKRKQLNDSEALLAELKQQMLALLQPCAQPIDINTKPFVLLMIGINGAGKTTSIAKICHYCLAQKKKLLLAAGDTFRAAAVEQLQAWGEQNNVPVIAQQSGADSASVMYDALDATLARDIDIAICDTAGRLHTQDHLMAELQKIKRVISKKIPEAPHEVMLVLDAGTGQNGLRQAKEFYQAMGVTGITLTKLDGTAKGGIILAIANELKLPIRFIGVGEAIDDLQPFDATSFVEAMFTEK